MSNFNNIESIMRDRGLQVPDENVYFKIPNAKEKMKILFEKFVPNYEWVEEYDRVAEWLSDNKGKGLFLYGNCGRGKTMLAKYIIPALLLVECGKIVNYYDILDLKTKFDEVIRYKILVVDDIGTEEVLVSFGNKTDIFSEIMDMVEKKSKLVIVTTNYQKNQLEERYGKRVLDRIIATTFRVCFTGKSFRGEL